MAKKLFVGGIPFSTTESTLQSLFSEMGEITSVKVVMDKMTGKSRGFAFVEMANDDEAEKAIAHFNGNEIEGRKVTVNEARPMEDRPRRSFR